MATIPTARTWANTTADGAAAALQNLTDCQEFLLGKPGAHVFRNSGLSVTLRTDTLITYDTEYYQNDNNWNDALNLTLDKDKLYINTAGIYNVTCGIAWGNGTGFGVGGETYLAVGKNMAGTMPGASNSNMVAHDMDAIPSNGWGGTTSAGITFGVPPMNHVDTMQRFAAGDYLQAWAYYSGASAAASRWLQAGQLGPHFFYLSVQWSDT